MKPALESVPDTPKVFVEEVDYLRLLNASEDSQLAASNVTNLKLQQQMLTMKMGMCDLTKQQLQGQLKDLQNEEKRASGIHEAMEKVYKEGVESAFMEKYKIPPKSQFNINRTTFELTISE